MSAGFYDYVRGRTDEIPPGYTEAGLKVYRHLVYLGAAQMIAAHYPNMRDTLGEENWEALIRNFVRQSAWRSHYYADLKGEFLQFLDALTQEPGAGSESKQTETLDDLNL